MRPSGLFLNDQHRSRSSSPGCHLFIYLLGKLDESKTHADTAALAVLLCFVKTLHRCHLSGPGGETSQSGNVLPSSIVFFFFLHGNLRRASQGYRDWVASIVSFVSLGRRPDFLVCDASSLSLSICVWPYLLIIFSFSVFFPPHVIHTWETCTRCIWSLLPSCNQKHCLTCSAWTLLTK